MARAFAIGVDVGGSKVAAGLVHEQGRVCRRISLPTPHGQGAAAVIGLIADMCRDLGANEAADADSRLPVGIGSPGVIDPRRGYVVTATDTMPGWKGTELADDLRRATGRRVVADNDANAFALGEHLYGAGRGASDALYATVGTSVGGGLVLQGRLLTGAHHSAGELGHFPVSGPGRDVCSCGRAGHLETAASGPAMAAAYARLTGRNTPPDLREVADGARHGDVDAVTVLRQGAEALGRTLAGLAAVFGPHRVVVGGGVAQIGAEYWTPLRHAFHSSGLPSTAAVDIEPAALGDDAGVAGAAALTLHHPTPAHDKRGTAPDR
ncbi:ROK family protein [Streptomyces xiangluensis]|uniref:ROK family protein n=1 Tax=Streptomyces xiangluensis TaxID=2665720 RepID=A0ABV8YLZ4_9ACTN